MAWANTGFGGSGVDTSAGTSITMSVGGLNATAGRVVLAFIAKDNASTTNGNTSEITGIVDSVGGNSWLPVREFCNSRGAANGGSVISVWYSILVNSIVGATVQANYSDTRTACCITLWTFSIAASNTISIAGSATDSAVTNSTVASMSISSLASAEYLFVRASGIETNSSDSAHPTTNWTNIDPTATTGGGAAANQAVQAEFHITTATGDTSAPTWTTSGDNASVMVALKEVASGTWKTTEGLAEASTKTVIGLANASIKTISGLT